MRPTDPRQHSGMPFGEDPDALSLSRDDAVCAEPLRDLARDETRVWARIEPVAHVVRSTSQIRAAPRGLELVKADVTGRTGGLSRWGSKGHSFSLEGRKGQTRSSGSIGHEMRMPVGKARHGAARRKPPRW